MAQRRTRRDRMREKDIRFFTGCDEQILAFDEILRAVEHNFEPPYRNTKTALAISGEGGMGKTSLLWAFEKICRSRNIQSIYLDLKRYEGANISTIVDFIHIWRPWFPKTRSRRLIGQDTFVEFDKASAKYQGLEEQLKVLEAKKTDPSALINQFSDLSSRTAVSLGKDLPLGQTVIALFGEERLREGIEAVLQGGVGLSREFLLRVFGKKEDVDFYYSHEEILIERFVEGVTKYVENKPLVMLLDTYEEVMDLDIVLRERLLEKLPETVILVFAGRNSLYDNCSLLWRDEIHFFELRGFNLEETARYLKQRGFEQAELIETIHNFTNGVPLAVALSVNAIERIRDEQVALNLFSGRAYSAPHVVERRRIVEEVAERFLSLVQPEERHIIQACAVLGKFGDGSPRCENRRDI